MLRASRQEGELTMGRALILWLAGIPIGIIALLWLFGVLN